MSGPAIATVGDNCIDRYRPPVGLSMVGGNAVNVAVQLARQQLPAVYFGAVGADAEGERTLRALRGHGVDTAHVQLRPGTTAYTDIEVRPDGERVIAFEEFGACRGYRPDDADVAALRRMRHVHLGWLDDAGDLKRALAAAQVGVSQDLGVNADPAHLRGAGLAIAFVSAGPSFERAARLVRGALAAGARIAVATCGALGSFASDGTAEKTAGIRLVNVVDTTGAGDAFAAGFLAAHVAGQPLQACLERGRDAAAGACTHLGGFPQVPEPLA